MKSSAALTVLALASAAFAASETPPPRLARRLPAGRVEALAARDRHNRALRDFFELSGVPSGSDASNIVLRTRALDALCRACTNAPSAKGGLGDAMKSVRDKNPSLFVNPRK